MHRFLKMNLPNKLTVARLFITAAFVAAMSIQMPLNATLALVLFLLAAATDYLDGEIARRWGMITDFGKLMDPLADKILTASAFILLVPLGAFPAWIVILIVSREFLITGLRMIAGAKGVVLPAERLGKHKTAWQMATIIYFLLVGAAMEWTTWPEAWVEIAWRVIGGGLTAVAAFLTVYSGLAYFYKNRGLLGTE